MHQHRDAERAQAVQETPQAAIFVRGVLTIFVVDQFCDFENRVLRPQARLQPVVLCQRVFDIRPRWRLVQFRQRRGTRGHRDFPCGRCGMTVSKLQLRVSTIKFASFPACYCCVQRFT